MKNLKFIIMLILAILCFSAVAFADVYVRGYTKKNGTYVAPHYRSSPNHTVRDNWSTKGNRNPYTGKLGTKTYRGTGSYQPSPPRRQGQFTDGITKPYPIQSDVLKPKSRGNGNINGLRFQ